MNEKSPTHPPSTPAAEPLTWRARYPATPEAVGMARRAAVAELVGAGQPDERCEAVALVVSELVTNAVRHGQVPGRLVELVLTHGPGATVTVRVSDAHPAAPVVHPTARGASGSHDDTEVRSDAATRAETAAPGDATDRAWTATPGEATDRSESTPVAPTAVRGVAAPVVPTAARGVAASVAPTTARGQAAPVAPTAAQGSSAAPQDPADQAKAAPGSAAAAGDPPQPPTIAPQHPPAAPESGHGLAIVAALAESWGVEPREVGKTVWARLD